MYKLVLADGTSIDGLTRLNKSTFELERQENDVHERLTDSNLAIALLIKEEDDMLVEIFIDYTRQNYSYINGRIRFRIASIEELAAAAKKREQKEKEKGGRKKWH